MCIMPKVAHIQTMVFRTTCITVYAFRYWCDLNSSCAVEVRYNLLCLLSYMHMKQTKGRMWLGFECAPNSRRQFAQKVHILTVGCKCNRLHKFRKIFNSLAQIKLTMFRMLNYSLLLPHPHDNRLRAQILSFLHYYSNLSIISGSHGTHL